MDSRPKVLQSKLSMVTWISFLIVSGLLVTVGASSRVFELDFLNLNSVRSNMVPQTPHNFDIPDYNQNDEEAIEIVSKLLEKLKELLKNGDTHHHISSIDPEEFNFSHTVEDENLQMTMNFDGLITNLSNLFWGRIYTCPLTMETQMELIVKDVLVNGTYNLTGIAYDAFPIFGDGDFKINIDQLRIVVIAEVTPKSGDYPLEMNDLNLHFQDVQGLKMNFENLMGDDDLALLLSHLAADISEKMAYDSLSNMEESPNALLYGILAERIGHITLLDLVSSMKNI